MIENKPWWWYAFQIGKIKILSFPHIVRLSGSMCMAANSISVREYLFGLNRSLEQFVEQMSPEDRTEFDNVVNYSESPLLRFRPPIPTDDAKIDTMITLLGLAQRVKEIDHERWLGNGLRYLSESLQVVLSIPWQEFKEMEKFKYALMDAHSNPQQYECECGGDHRMQF